jgi:hypothetical protein
LLRGQELAPLLIGMGDFKLFRTMGIIRHIGHGSLPDRKSAGFGGFAELSAIVKARAPPRDLTGAGDHKFARKAMRPTPNCRFLLVSKAAKPAIVIAAAKLRLSKVRKKWALRSKAVNLPRLSCATTPDRCKTDREHVLPSSRGHARLPMNHCVVTIGPTCSSKQSCCRGRLCAAQRPRPAHRICTVAVAASIGADFAGGWGATGLGAVCATTAAPHHSVVIAARTSAPSRRK